MRVWVACASVSAVLATAPAAYPCDFHDAPFGFGGFGAFPFNPSASLVERARAPANADADEDRRPRMSNGERPARAQPSPPRPSFGGRAFDVARATRERAGRDMAILAAPQPAVEPRDPETTR